MTVVSCTLAKADADLTLDGVRQGGSVQLQYNIESDNINQMPLSIFTQAYSSSPDPLPQRYSVYNVKGETDNAIYCTQLRLRRVHQSGGAPTHKWKCDVLFTVPDPGLSGAHMVADPFARPPVYWFETRDFTMQVLDAYLEQAIPQPVGGNLHEAGDYTAIVNAVNERVEGGLQEDRANVIMCAEKAWPDVATMLTQQVTYQNTTNSDVFFGQPAKQAAYVGLTCNPQFDENGTLYYQGVERVAFGKEFKDIHHELVNEGFQYYQAGTTTKVQKQDLTQVLLNANGTELPAGTVGNTIKWRTKELAVYTGNVLV